MSDGSNPPSFYESLEHFWEGVSVVTFIIGILALLIAPNLDFTEADGVNLLLVSAVCILQALYFDRKTQQAEIRQAGMRPKN